MKILARDVQKSQSFYMARHPYRIFTKTGEFHGAYKYVVCTTFNKMTGAKGEGSVLFEAEVILTPVCGK